mmetsp:Transcript_28112/g.80916  ORF Transcript_28112/g.80916 Transcript_28112/m.80916 type:complete len:232 (+) Transcript_28112:238-933(+)
MTRHSAERALDRNTKNVTLQSLSRAGRHLWCPASTHSDGTHTHGQCMHTRHLNVTHASFIQPTRIIHSANTHPLARQPPIASESASGFLPMSSLSMNLPVASQCAQPGGSVAALASYRMTCSGVKTSFHRPFVPLLMKVFAPPSHTLPPAGANRWACSFMCSNVHRSTCSSKMVSSMGMFRKAATRRISPGRSFLSLLKCTNSTLGRPRRCHHDSTLVNSDHHGQPSVSQG